jgi:hypothetical protein
MQSESKFQATCFQNHWNFYPQHRRRLFCINNNSQNALKGAINKAIGVVSGVSDMIYLKPNGKVSFLEFKIPGGYQSEKQKQWEVLCKELGHEYVLIYTEDDFWSAVELDNPIQVSA